MSSKIFYAPPGWAKRSAARRLSPRTASPPATISIGAAACFRGPSTSLPAKSYVGRILVLDAAKGGVATAWMLYEMMSREMMPAALVLNAVNPIMVQGAALAGATLISGFECDITAAIPNGAMVEIDPDGERPSIRIL